MNVVSVMTVLSMRRPATDAADDVVAAWYDAKARLHEYLAAEGGPDTEQEMAYARAALRHSWVTLHPTISAA